jgi:hypothetical protein
MTSIDIETRGRELAQAWQDAEARELVKGARRERTLLAVMLVCAAHAIPFVLALVLGAS